MVVFPISLGKSIIKASKALKRGDGSTWPGHIALKLDPNIINSLIKKNPHLKIILIAGTNGKTSTTKFIQEVLEQQEKKVLRNESGANLLNGVTSTLIKHSTLSGKINSDVALFEIDENSLPQVLKHINPSGIILLNLFRDQLDRYGEVNSIAKKWQDSFRNLSKETILVVNGDDPMLKFIGEKSNLQTFYFGINEKNMEQKAAGHDVDFLYCPNCQTKLTYKKRSYSHMGIYECLNCKFSHKKTSTFDDLPNPLLGTFNKYNINAAALILQKMFDISEESVKKTLLEFSPAFGRQEVIDYKNKKIVLLLSKNPTGFNQSIKAILDKEKNPNVLLLLNDKIPDGRDISWIWDVEFEELKNAQHITISGDRAYDMGLRIKYCEIQNTKYQILASLKESIEFATSKLGDNETLYILTTYSAMLDARKILIGKKIL